MKFTKMHGLGNDYVYINTMAEKVEHPGQLARTLSERHTGIGADGLILIGGSQTADFSMDIYNADGSRGEMCGNGIRCVAKYVYDKQLTKKTQIAIETLSGVKYVHLKLAGEQVEVNMGKPWFAVQKTPLKVEEHTYSVTRVSMGNPHAVLFVEDTEYFPVARLGPLIETHELFPNRVNTEFCQILDRETIRMRVWERGSGETQACGTGACAAAVAAVLNDLTEPAVTIKLLGGDLFVRWDRLQNRIFMTGPAATVFDGEINIDQ